jgi:hypothetical protein
MSDSNEQKKRNSEKINFAQQGATENAQFMIAITVGIFGILTMFLMINHDDTAHKVNLGLKLQNGFLGKGLWAIAEGTILSIAYWALVLFGFQSYITRRMFEGLMGYYVNNMYPEWYDEDIKNIAKENKLAKWMVENIWASGDSKRYRYKYLWSITILYFAITFFLYFFVAIL